MPTRSTLGELLDAITVGYVGPMLNEYVERGIPFLRSLNVKPYYFDSADLRFITPEFHEKIKKSALKPGDVVTVRTGNAGAACVIPESLEIANCSDLVIFRCGEKVDPYYLSYYINLISGSHVRNHAVGAVQKHFNVSSAKDTPFPNVGIREQKEVASVLSILDAKIDLNNRINAELEALAKTVYDYWFVQFDFPDANGRPYRSSGGAMVWNEALRREVPEGWEVGSLDSLGRIVGGSTPSTTNPDHFGNGVPWITPKDLSNNKGNKFIARGETDVTEQGMKSASLSVYPAGTVLMSSRAPVGYLAIALNPVTTNQGFKSFVPSKGYATAFVYYAVERSLPAIIQYASGSTFVEISGGVLKSVQSVLPDKKVANAFCQVIEPIVDRQRTAELENRELTRLRDWLLPLLMNGQVRVT